MGEAQWFQPTVVNRLSQAIVLATFYINYGKFYDINNAYHGAGSVQGTKIRSRDQFEWGHCGLENSPTGTEGSVEIRLDESGEKIAEIYWDCPWSSSANKLTKKYVKDGYYVAIEGFNISSGVLEKGTITILKD